MKCALRWALVGMVAVLAVAVAEDQKTALCACTYRRREFFVNGELHKGGVKIFPGDVLTTGDDPATSVTLKYPDSSVVYLKGIHLRAVAREGGFDLERGGMTIDAVRGTKLLTDIVTPAGRLVLNGATLSLKVDEEGATTYEVSWGTPELHSPLPEGSDLSVAVITVQEKQSATVKASEDGRTLDVFAKKGGATVTLAGGAQVGVPEAAGVNIRCADTGTSAELTARGGELTITSDNPQKSTTGNVSVVFLKGVGPKPKGPVLATISYWRHPLVINDIRVRGAQNVYEGDVVQSGDNSGAKVTLKYQDSTAIYLFGAKTTVVPRPTGLDIRSGRLSADVVLGTELMVDFGTPAGRIAINGATLQVTVKDKTISADVQWGEPVIESLAPEGATGPLVQVTAFAECAASLSVEDGGRTVEVTGKKGAVLVLVAGGAHCTLRAKDRVQVKCAEDNRTAVLAVLEGRANKLALPLTNPKDLEEGAAVELLLQGFAAEQEAQ